jgi:hypothetical protein
MRDNLLGNLTGVVEEFFMVLKKGALRVECHES